MKVTVQDIIRWALTIAALYFLGRHLPWQGTVLIAFNAAEIEILSWIVKGHSLILRDLMKTEEERLNEELARLRARRKP